MARLPITLAVENYDRVQALRDGRVAVDGVDLTVLTQPVEETFFRMIRYREFDAAEMSLSSYTLSLGRPDPAFVAIPVFPSRMFRHSSIYVSTRSGITEPAQLVGRRVGVPEYQLTAPVWIRGTLADEYGVPVDGVEYLSGGEEEPGRTEKIPVTPPAGVKLSPIPPDATLSQMLADGEIDALHTARAPSTLLTRPDDVRRLFPDFVPVELDYFRRTRILPIMHVVVLRRDVYEKAPWLARNLFTAFELSKRLAQDALRSTAALQTMLPWQIAEVARATEELGRDTGGDWWPYGVAPNRHVLETFLRYHHEQGLSPVRLEPEQLFAPETAEAFVI